MRNVIVTIVLLALCVGAIPPAYAADFVQVYEEVSGSVVRIECDGWHTGSGFIIDVEGLIMTARHVVDGEGSYAVVLANGDRFCVEEIKASERFDAAILRVSEEGQRVFQTSLKLETRVSICEPILVVGSPFETRYENYATVGIISQIGVMDTYLSQTPMIMIDACISPGNSGGPVFDAEGKVIGIAIAMDTRGHGLGFVTPAIDLIELLMEWYDEREEETKTN